MASHTRTLLATLGLLCAGASAAGAQPAPARGPAAVDGYWTDEPDTSRRTLLAARVRGDAPAIDGRLDDDAWRAAQVATDFVQLQPTPGAPASQRTEARVLYDAEALYIAMRLYDTAPDSIVANLARRDQAVHSDWAHVGIDSYHDRRTAFRFSVNPAGARLDALHFDDTSDDDGWDAVWAVATRIDSLGWTAEFRIPLSQLRFRSAGEAGQTWGINFARDLARHGETSFWAPMRPDVPGLVSRFGDLEGIQGLEPPRNLEALPYAVARVTRAPGEAADPFHEPTEPFGALGADLKYGLTSDLTLSATINPDFGQVEADPSQVNLSAYETFLSERRPFFLEGGDIFRFGIGLGDGGMGNEQLFYSRRIGRAPQGGVDGDYTDVPASTTILGAAKLSGKTAGGWSVGFLDALTAGERGRWVDGDGEIRSAPVEPLTNYSVARIRRGFGERGQSIFGGIFTATNRRLEAGGDLDFLRSAAYTGGLDVRHRFGGGNYELTGFLVGSYVAGSDSAIARTQRRAGHYFQRPDAEHLTYDPSRTSLAGYAASVSLFKQGGGHWRGGAIAHVVSPGLEVNDLGYQRMGDISMVAAGLTYVQFEPGERLRDWSIGANLWSGWTFGNAAGAVLPFAGDHVELGGNINGGFTLQNFWGGSFWTNRAWAALDPFALRGGPAIERPGNFNVGFYLHGDQRKPVSVTLNASGWWEDETDGRNLGVHPGVRLRPSSRVELSLSPGLSWNREAAQYVTDARVAGETRYVFARLDQTTASLTARLGYTFSPALSLQFYAQPFVSAGRYRGFMEVADPRASRFEQRFERLGERIAYDEQAEGYDVLDAAGRRLYGFGDPDFNFKQLNSNAVLRWEWRPGSTLFLVWSQGRQGFERDGSFEPGRDFGRLLGAGDRVETTNVLMIKASYWLGL